jgi:hypothetical protein
LLNRKPPFGTDVISMAKSLPRYSLSVTERSISSGELGSVEVKLSIQCGLLEEVERKGRRKALGRDITYVLTVTSDLDFVDFRRIPYVYLFSRLALSHRILQNESPSLCEDVHGHRGTHQTESVNHRSHVKCTCGLLLAGDLTHVGARWQEDIAGIGISHTYKPEVDPSAFPTLDTRPTAFMVRARDGRASRHLIELQGVDAQHNEALMHDDQAGTYPFPSHPDFIHLILFLVMCSFSVQKTSLLPDSITKNAL